MKKIIENFLEQRVEGIIIIPVNKHITDTQYFNILEQNKTPYIFVSSFYPSVNNAMHVMIDLEEGTYMLVKYLIDLEHKDILFMCMDPNIITTNFRIDGYIEAFNEK